MDFLFDNFEILAQAPNGIQKLREMILQLAVQGKLVPQDPNDEPASILLEKIKAEKEKLIKEGKIKKQKPLEPVNKKELPYKIPNNWKWTRLPNICIKITDGAHHTPKYVSQGIPFLSIKDISSGYINFQNTKFITEEDHKALTKRCNPQKGDIIFCRIGTLGKASLIETNKPFSIFVSVGLLKLPINNLYGKYIEYMLNSPEAYRQYEKIKAGGSHTNKLNLSSMPFVTIPLPPLAEQKRIVNKVDSLIALCDELEKQQQNKNYKKETLNKSALFALDNSQSKKDFNTQWDFIAKNFNLLFKTQEDVERLKQTILQLAVQGKLVPQDPNDEPASILLEKIKTEKEKLIKSGKIKKQKPLETIKNNEESPYNLPKGWKLCKLGLLHYFLSGYAFKSNTYVNTKKNQIIRLGNVKNNQLLLNQNPVYIPDNIATFASDYKLFANDLLITMTGTKNKKDYCFTAIVDNNIAKYNLYLNQRVGCLRFTKSINIQLINIFLKTNILLNSLFSSATGTANQANIGVEAIRNLYFPLPPLAEQKRIVKKVDSLMTLCDSLSKTIEEKTNKNESLINSVLAKI